MLKNLLLRHSNKALALVSVALCAVQAHFNPDMAVGFLVVGVFLATIAIYLDL